MAPVLCLDEEPISRGDRFWTWDGNLGSLKFPVRMHVVQYAERKTPKVKKLIVISPLEPTAKVVDWLKETGAVTFIVAPNKYHWYWAHPMKEAFPEAQLLGPEGLAAKLPGPLDHSIPPAVVPPGNVIMPDDWPADVEVLQVLGLTHLQELVFYHPPSSTLVLTDTAFNFDRSVPKPLVPQSLLVRLYLSAAEGYKRCCMTKPFWLLIRDAEATRSSLDAILRWDFDQVSVCHGSFISSGGKAALRQGTYAFVNGMCKKGGSQGGTGQDAGAVAAVTAAGALALAGVGFGIAAAVQARRRG